MTREWGILYKNVIRTFNIYYLCSWLRCFEFGSLLHITRVEFKAQLHDGRDLNCFELLWNVLVWEVFMEKMVFFDKIALFVWHTWHYCSLHYWCVFYFSSANKKLCIATYLPYSSFSFCRPCHKCVPLAL